MIPLYKPYMPDLPDLDSILHSGELAAGRYTKEFERRLASFMDIDAESVLATNSFNMAIFVVISLLNIKLGDEIIASPMACLNSTQPFASFGISIKWADIDPYTGTLCPDDVRKKISYKTRAIVHNHFCGYLGYVDEINAIGKEYGLTIIDDGIEAFGSKYNDHLIGNVGSDITIFSFSPVRIPNTIDGGAIIIRDKSLIEEAAKIRDCGIDRSIFRDDLGEINPECDITLPGHSATMSNVNAYIGIRQMDNIEEVLKTQKKNALKWKDRFDREEQKKIRGIDGYRRETDPNYWVYGILCDNKRKTIEHFRKEGWYASGVHINNNIYSIFGEQKPLPGVEEFYNRFVALPCGWWI